MNKTIRTIALIAVLGTMTVSCQKEQEIEPQSSVTEIGTVYTVQYTVDGVLHLETLIGEQAWSDFLHRMLALAEEGYEVSVSNENITSRVVATKEVVTYSSSSQEDAYSWCDKMVLSGYTVTDSQLNDVGASQIHYVMGNTVTDPNKFKNALINQWGHGDVITQCFSTYGF